MGRIKIYGGTCLAGGGSLGMLTLLAAGIGLFAPEGTAALVLWGLLAVLGLVHEAVGRALLYVLVTPTTMPGAFFWNNRYFERHARATGLAHRPQVGVAPEAH